MTACVAPPGRKEMQYVYSSWKVEPHTAAKLSCDGRVHAAAQDRTNRMAVSHHGIVCLSGRRTCACMYLIAEPYRGQASFTRPCS